MQQLKRSVAGFTLTELAVVAAIVALLIGGTMMTLNAQVEVRNNDEALRRLNAAADAIYAFAIVNGRLPCPARFVSTSSNSGGQESFCPSASGTCSGGETTTIQTHGNCSNFYDGYVPAATVGLTPVDSYGFALDPWGNRLRYVLARDYLSGSCTTTPPASDTRIWSSKLNLKSYGVSCAPNDLDVCASSTGTSATSCGTATRVVSASTVLMILYSTGKNGATAIDYGADESANTDGNAVFVTRTMSGSDATVGKYDDVMVIVPVGIVISKMVSAGVLP